MLSVNCGNYPLEQATGPSPVAVMSQKAVTDELSALETLINEIGSVQESGGGLPGAEAGEINIRLDQLESGKVDKESGKGLSANDYTDAYKAKLDGVAEGANKTNVVNALNSTSTVDALSAAQGKALSDGKANIASPAFSGTPTAPTAGAAVNNTQIATTAFVKSQGYAALASPAFSGTPTAPTAGAAVNNTQIATTAFAQALFRPLAGKSLGTPNLNDVRGPFFGGYSNGAGNNPVATYGHIICTGGWNGEFSNVYDCQIVIPSNLSGIYVRIRTETGWLAWKKAALS